MRMLERKELFSNVIEINFQAGRVFGCNVYLIHDGDQWVLVDIGYDDTVVEIVELIRQLDFPFSQCKTLIASHADIDHVQGLARAKRMLKTEVTTHRLAAPILESGDRLRSFAHIPAQGIDLEMPIVDVEHTVDEGDRIQVGSRELEVWHMPGHTHNQLGLKMGNLLFSGDSIYRDGCIGAIDAHHGSDMIAFIKTLHRIRSSDVEWLLPGHGPIFRKDNDLLDRVIARLERYLHRADFGTCAVDWPLMDQWEQEVAEGKRPE